MRVAGRPDVDTLYRVKNLLDRHHLPYTLMGSLAVELHGARPYTSTIELLIAHAAFDVFCEHAAKAGFEQNPVRPRRFVDRRNQANFEMFLTGHHPGRTGPTPIAFPDPMEASETREASRVLTLPWLIQLKLGANTYGDKADIVHLIQALDLDEAMIERLHPSAHADYLECLDERWREELFEARHDAELERLEREAKAKKS
jgi:hypothetical protein